MRLPAPHVDWRQLYGVPRPLSYQYSFQLSMARTREFRYQLTPAVSDSAPFSAVRPPPVMPLLMLPSKKSTGSSDENLSCE